MQGGWEDHEAIRNLLASYSFVLDRRRFEELGALLADATFSLSWPAEGVETGEIRGRERIERFYSEHMDGRRQSRHVITNARIEIEPGGDAAAVEAYLTSVGYDPGEVVILSGRYEDRFERLGGEWRITRKHIVMELPA